MRRHTRTAWTVRLACLAVLGAAGLASASTASTAADAEGSEHTPAVVVAKVTGPGSVSATDTKWAVTGTDLGIAWDNGSGQTLTLFGDTFGAWSGPGGGGGDWRSNVLLRSDDKDLTDGITYSSAPVDRPGHAKELIPSAKVDNVEMTTIPTAATSIGNRQVMAYMSVKHWGPPGLWDTNFNQFAWSDDNGENWSTQGAPRWTNTADGNHPFQMAAFVKRDGYLYMFGTPNGRVGAAHVARVPEASAFDKSAWRYWDGKRWGTDDLAASAVVPAPVSELSVAWNEYTKSYLMMYLKGPNIVLRHAPAPEGPWSEPQVAASFADHPALYGGFIDPRSSGSDLYFVMSMWNPYNSYLLRVSLDPSGRIVNPNVVADGGWERQTTSGTSAPWVCTGRCGTDASHVTAHVGDHNGWVRNNRGWNSLHQDLRVEPSTDYVFTGWIRTSGNVDNGYIGVRSPGRQIISERNFRATTAWTRVEIPFNSGDRSAIQVFGGIWTDNGDMWLQLDDFSVVKARTATPPPVGVSANVSAVSQCNRQTANLQVRVVNDEAIPMKVHVGTAIGSRSKSRLASGDTFATSFIARKPKSSLPSGQVTVTVTVQRPTGPVSADYTVGYQDVSC